MGRACERRPAGRAAATERVALETERLRLEPVESSHARGLYEAVVASRNELLPWMPWAKEPTLEGNQSMAARDEKAWREGRVFHFALVEKGTGLVLGVAGLNRSGAEECELHYWIRTSHAGRGLTTEAGYALIGWAREGLNVRRLTLWAGRDNFASRRVAEKLGFVDHGPLDWRPEGGLGNFDAEAYELRFSS